MSRDDENPSVFFFSGFHVSLLWRFLLNTINWGALEHGFPGLFLSASFFCSLSFKDFTYVAVCRDTQGLCLMAVKHKLNAKLVAPEGPSGVLEKFVASAERDIKVLLI